MATSNNSRAKAAQYRQSEKGRETRRMYNMQPQVKYHKAVKAAMKKHQTPPTLKN